MKFSFGSVLVMASSAMAQLSYLPPPPPPLYSSSSSSGIVAPLSGTSGSSSVTTVPVTFSPSSSTTAPTSSVTSAVGPPIVTGTVTDELTSTYCDKCDEVYTTIYPVTYVDVCPTGTTANVYTITETCTGNSASFTPTTCPPGFTTYTTECEVCAEKTITVTAPVSVPTTTAAPAPPPYTAPPAPKVKPAGTTYSYPPAVTTGPQLVTVNAAAGSNVQFFSVVVGLFGAVFAGMVML